MKKLTLISTLALIALLVAGQAQAEDGEQYRTLLKEKSQYIVTVKFVLKLNLGAMGGGRTQEMNQEVLGCMVDATGLVMLAGSNLGGTQNMRAMGRSIEIKTTASDFKVIFGNETEEYEAVLAAKDSKLNLGFVQIKDLKGKTVSTLTLDDKVEPTVGQGVVSVLRFGRGFDFAPYFTLGRVSGAVKMPRKMWPVAGGLSSVGLPVFNLTGQSVGVLVAQEGATGGGGSMNIMQMLRGGGGGGGGNTGFFIIPNKKVVLTIDQARKKAKEALGKAKEAEGEDEGDEDEGEEEEDGQDEDDGMSRGKGAPEKVVKKAS